MKAFLAQVVMLFTHWVQPLGPFGLFFLSLGDSSIIPLPEIVDILLMVYCSQTPSLSAFFVLLAALGSACGSLLIYFFGKKVGQTVLSRKYGPEKITALQDKLQRYDILFLMLTGILPAPYPYKLSLLSAGALQVKLPRFLLGVFLGRVIRFGSEGLVAAFFGHQIISWFLSHTGIFFVGITFLALLSLYAWKRSYRRGILIFSSRN